MQEVCAKPELICGFWIIYLTINYEVILFWLLRILAGSINSSRELQLFFGLVICSTFIKFALYPYPSLSLFFNFMTIYTILYFYFSFLVIDCVHMTNFRRICIVEMFKAEVQHQNCLEMKAGAQHFLQILMNTKRQLLNSLVKFILYHLGQWVYYQTARTRLTTLRRYNCKTLKMSRNIFFCANK